MLLIDQPSIKVINNTIKAQVAISSVYFIDPRDLGLVWELYLGLEIRQIYVNMC